MLVEISDIELPSGHRLVLRSPDASDAAAMLAFIRQLSRESWRYLNHPPEHFEAFDEVMEASFLDSAVNHPRSFLVTAWSDGAVVGSAGTMTVPGTFSVHCAELGLGVLDAWQGRGVGRALLRRVIDESARVGVWNLTLRVRTFNERAIRLYDQFDFTRIGRLRAVACLPDGVADEYLYQRLDERADRMRSTQESGGAAP